jgi:hypothetical protein
MGMFSLKNQAGFEPGFSPKADAMITAPRRQGSYVVHISCEYRDRTQYVFILRRFPISTKI